MRWEIVSTTAGTEGATIARSEACNLLDYHKTLHSQQAPLQISFYCGHEPECDEFGSEAALSIAKRNVEKYFAVVGVLELLDLSLEVLENYVPRFFQVRQTTKQEKNRLSLLPH